MTLQQQIESKSDRFPAGRAGFTFIGLSRNSIKVEESRFYLLRDGSSEFDWRLKTGGWLEF
jgi:hypothetical protein